jgi:hypothetical protein
VLIGANLSVTVPARLSLETTTLILNLYHFTDPSGNSSIHCKEIRQKVSDFFTVDAISPFLCRFFRFQYELTFLWCKENSGAHGAAPIWKMIINTTK